MHCHFWDNILSYKSIRIYELILNPKTINFVLCLNIIEFLVIE